MLCVCIRMYKCLYMYTGHVLDTTVQFYACTCRTHVLQERELSRGMDVVCSTPGRLNDHLKRGSLVSTVYSICAD